MEKSGVAEGPHDVVGLTEDSPCSGAALAAMLRVEAGVGKGLVLNIFADGGTKYLNERFSEEGK